MKKSVKLALLALAISLNACSKDETDKNTCVADNYTIQVDRALSKLITTHPGNLPTIRNYDYSYNTYNLLEQVNEYTFDVSSVKNFTYKCSNNIHEITKNDSDLHYAYQYDSDNRLISYTTTNSYLHDYKVTYTANTITVTGIVNAQNTSLILETNQEGFVTKIIREDGYSTFGYDANNNLIEAKDYSNDNNTPLKDFEISYDANPNPFYGQLQSSYLVQFINYFSESAFLGIDVFFRFNQFNFPYLKNNPTLLKDNDCAPCYQDLIERTYQYDAQNYPIKIEENYVGAPAIIYEFEYQN